jgi:hypothetical protein
MVRIWLLEDDRHAEMRIIAAIVEVAYVEMRHGGTVLIWPTASLAVKQKCPIGKTDNSALLEDSSRSPSGIENRA